jgi:hypothetical protein
MHRILEGTIVNREVLEQAGVPAPILVKAVEELYDVLDTLDEAMQKKGMMPLSANVELATYSAIIGNTFAASLASLLDTRFLKNNPHKFPDLISLDETYHPIEIKVALEKNSPKGHLVKPGYYFTCRYVLCDCDGKFSLRKRGTRAYIWELRCGLLTESHFGASDTLGDSGKTAWVNELGMAELQVVFFDKGRAPYKENGIVMKRYDQLLSEPHNKSTPIQNKLLSS